MPLTSIPEEAPPKKTVSSVAEVNSLNEDEEDGEFIDGASQYPNGAQSLKDSVVSAAPLRQVESDGGFSEILQEILGIINSASAASIINALNTFPSGDIKETHCDHLV